jgi:hypothetical protein
MIWDLIQSVSDLTLSPAFEAWSTKLVWMNMFTFPAKTTQPLCGFDREG